MARPNDRLAQGKSGSTLPSFAFEEKSSWEPDQFSSRVLALLEEVVQKQLHLQEVVQQHQQVLLVKLDSALPSQAGSKMSTGPSGYEVNAKLESNLVTQPPQEPADKGVAVAVVKKDRNSRTSTGSKERPAPPRPLLSRILHHNYFEGGMALVILSNMWIMFVSLQFKGLYMGYALGVAESDGDWMTHKPRFDMIENFLNGIYVIELLMRLCCFGCGFVKDPSNVMDAFIVISSCLDVYVFGPLNIKVVNLSVLRLVRLSRIFRLAKVLRSSEIFSELRVLIRTLCIAVRGIVWSVFLLSFIIVAGGILMAQMAIQFLDNESVTVERREWLYIHFGTAMSSMYTMFECTFTGAWRFYSRPLIEEVSYFFAFFWLAWVIMVNFTTMRVVGALFLKETMAVSARDAENCAMMQLKNKGTSAEALRVMFNEADSSGDGLINGKEFNAMMEHDEVVDMFKSMGLDPDEVAAFFTVLSADDGAADYAEFITGALAMASSAPTLDRLKAMQNQIKIETLVHQNTAYLASIMKHLCLSTEEEHYNPSG